MGGSTLSDQFLTDHQRFTQAIYRLHLNLRQHEDAMAFRLAEDLDRIGGSHIAFEEEVLYPLVGKYGEPDFEKQLYEEHEEVLVALRALLALDPKKPLPEDVRNQILAGLETGLHHVESCGTLVSRLEALPKPDQEKALERLLELNREGTRWSELPQRAKRD